MAHFAKIDENNIVVQVLVVPNEQEHRGQDYLANDLGLGGTWIQTSYNASIRSKFAGIGDIYNSELDRFIVKQPYPSWVLNEDFLWDPPIPRPERGGTWDEETLSWTFPYRHLWDATETENN